jgi:hypothetical protein
MEGDTPQVENPPAEEVQAPANKGNVEAAEEPAQEVEAVQEPEEVPEEIPNPKSNSNANDPRKFDLNFKIFVTFLTSSNKILHNDL